MSRLIVKNLPKKITDTSLRELFAQVGTLTELQLKRKPDGKARQFAFVGYHTESDAETAIKSFDNTYIGTCKIAVQPCSKLGEVETKAKKKKGIRVKETEESTGVADKFNNNKSKSKRNDEAEILQKYKDDPMFIEFLQLHAPKQTEKLKHLDSKTIESRESDRADSEDAVENSKKDGEGKETESRTKQAQKKKHKDIVLYNVKLRNLPWNFKKADIRNFFKPLQCFSIRMKQKSLRIAYVGFKAERFRQKALLKDKSYLNGVCVRVSKLDSPDSRNEAEKNKPGSNGKWKRQEDSVANEESIAESGIIFLRNLAYTTTEEDVEQLFSKFGPLSEVHLPVDPNTRQKKGFGTVTYLMPEHAAKAYSELDGSVLHGRMLHLLPGKTKDTPDDKEASTDFKTKKLKNQKSQAGKSHNWNALFLDHNAVAEVIVERYGTTKETLLGPDGKGSVPVRLALSETQIVAETRKYLEGMGVKLDAFSKGDLTRSKNVLLVKNLPSKTQVRELREIFEAHGLLGRIILPPSGLTAIVEFLDPSEAKKAFTRLAYSKFKDAPLYLEWAPKDSLERRDDDDNGDAQVATSKNVNEHKQEENSRSKNVEREEELIVKVNEVKEQEHIKSQPKKNPEPHTTLFVKNLDPSITEDVLKKHFEVCGEVHYTSVNKKNNARKSGDKSSVRTGFVRYLARSAADKALKELQGSMLGGNAIVLAQSDRIEKGDRDDNDASLEQEEQSSLKILVRNVPFAATRKEVEEIFSTFGGIKHVRLPKKWGTPEQHRGFGFVEFTNEKDAKVAFEALCQSTHLLGRRLNLEWAKTHEDVQETRKRTADHFVVSKQKKSKKSVFNID